MTVYPSDRAICMTLSRVIPSRISSVMAGVRMIPFLTMKIFIALHSLTLPAAFMRMASSKPRLNASVFARALVI